MNKTLILSAALALASLSNVALAAEGAAGFVRGEIGNTDIEVEGASDNDTTYGIRGGYFFNKNFAVEGFATNLYDADGATITAVGAGLVAKHNFGADGNGFFIAGRGGVAHITVDVGPSDSSTKGYIGAGVGYDFSEAWGLSLNYDVINSEFEGVDIDTDTLTLGAEFRF